MSINIIFEQDRLYLSFEITTRTRFYVTVTLGPTKHYKV